MSFVGRLGLIALGLLCCCKPAHATVVNPCAIENHSPLPADGWLPLGRPLDGLAASVDGRPLAGAEVDVEGYWFWRPDAPLTSGTDVLFTFDRCRNAGGMPFPVRFEGRTLEPRLELLTSLALVLDEASPTSTSSCRADPELLREAGYCECAAGECDC